MPRINPNAGDNDPLWPKAFEWPGGRALAPLRKAQPPLPRDIEDEPANETQPWIMDPENRPAAPPKGDVQTGEKIGPSFTKLPRDVQRGAVNKSFDQMVSTAKATKGSVFDTTFDKALRFGASDAMGGIGPTPAVVANPEHIFFKKLLERIPKLAGALQKMKPVTEYKSATPRPNWNAYGTTTALTPADAAVVRGGDFKFVPQAGVTRPDLVKMANRPPGSSLQTYPYSGAKMPFDETLAHEGYHALYAAKDPIMMGPKMGAARAQELTVRTLKRAGVDDDTIVRILGQYKGDEGHGLIEALARFANAKAGGFTIK